MPLDAVEVEPDPVRAGAHIGLGHEGVILDGAGPPGAAVDEHVDRRVRLGRREHVELLHRGRAVGDTLRRAEPRPHAVAVEHVALVDLIAVRRVDELVVGVVERLLVHVEPDQRALRLLHLGGLVHRVLLFLFRELHLREHGAPGQTIRVGERLEQFEVVVACADDQLDRFAGGRHGGGEVARLALEFRRLAGADGENERRMQPIDETAAAQLVRPSRR